MNENYFRPPRFSNPKFPSSQEQLEKVTPYKPHTYANRTTGRLKSFFKKLIADWKWFIS